MDETLLPRYRICPLISENHHLEWRLVFLNYNSYNPFCPYLCSLAAFIFALEELFFLLATFIVWQAICYCLSSIKFLTLLICSCTYSFCSFWNVLINSLCAFLSSLRLHLLVLFYYIRVVFSGYLVFFLTATVSGTVLLVPGFVVMHSATASIWELTRFSILSFGVRVSDIFWSVSNLFLSVTAIFLLLICLLSSEDQS